MLDLSRVTEETAIRASSLLGLSIGINRGHRGSPKPFFTQIQETTAKRLLTREMIKAIAASGCGPFRLANIDPTFWGGSDADQAVRIELDPELKQFATILRGEAAFGMDESSGTGPTELAIAPVDGIDAVLAGRHGGSASVLVGASAGCLALPTAPPRNGGHPKDCPNFQLGLDRFFVTVFPSEAVGQAYLEAIPKGVANGGTEHVRPEECKVLQGAFEAVGEAIGDDVRLPTLVTVSPKKEFGFVSLGPSIGRVREFDGSPVAAVLALGNPRNNIDGFYGVVRASAALMIAVAAKCVGHHFCAIPVQHWQRPAARSKTKSGSSSQGKQSVEARGDREPDSGTSPDSRARLGSFACLAPGAQVVSVKDFVTTNDTFLVATGITIHPVFHGVRVIDDGGRKRIRTESIILNAASRTERRLRHTRCTEWDTFMGSNGQGIPILEAIRSFRDELAR